MSERAKKAKLNIISVFGLEIVTVLSGLILPRLILSSFGSDINGLVTSVNQFITCVSLLRAGVGGVTRAALYKPLDQGDLDAVSGIVSATAKFMRKLTVQYTVFLVVFAVAYPLFVKESFSWGYSFSMVLILGLSTFFDCCFGITYHFLLQADQKRYINSFLQILMVLSNVLVSAILIKANAPVHIVKLGSSLVFSVKPLILWAYVHKKYKLNWKARPDNFAIEQRWDAFSHQIAFFVNNNTDVMLLTIFSDIKVVSVYSVYNMVTASLRQLILSLTSGLEAYFGNVIARKEELKSKFETFELASFFVSAFVFLCVAFLITPFVLVYTDGVNDADYSQFGFGVVMAVAQFMYCIRMPYNILTDTAGHFKQTKNAATAEAVINIIISIILIQFIGLIGVEIGTFIAATFRTIYLVLYSNKVFLPGCVKTFIKHIVSCVCAAAASAFCISLIPAGQIADFSDWFVYAIIVGSVCLCTMVLSYLIFFNKKIISMIKALNKRSKKI